MLMTARMTNPAFAVTGAMDALNALSKTISRAHVPISHELGALVLDIATVNLWNRLNIATRQVVGAQSW